MIFLAKLASLGKQFVVNGKNAMGAFRRIYPSRQGVVGILFPIVADRQDARICMWAEDLAT